MCVHAVMYATQAPLYEPFLFSFCFRYALYESVNQQPVPDATQPGMGDFALSLPGFYTNTHPKQKAMSDSIVFRPCCRMQPSPDYHIKRQVPPLSLDSRSQIQAH